MVFGGLITIMLLGFLLDQIPDPNFAGLMIPDQTDEAEKGLAKGAGKGERKAKAASDRSDGNSKSKIGSKTSFPANLQR